MGGCQDVLCCCHGVAKVLWLVSRVLLRCFVWLPGRSRGTISGCQCVAKVFCVVARALPRYNKWLPRHY